MTGTPPPPPEPADAPAPSPAQPSPEVTLIESTLLRIHISERDFCGSHPAYEAIVMAARDQGLCGATVLRGVLGYGRSTRLHSAKILRLSNDLPLVVELIDQEARIIAFLPVLRRLLDGLGFITLEKVRVLAPSA